MKEKIIIILSLLIILSSSVTFGASIENKIKLNEKTFLEEKYFEINDKNIVFLEKNGPVEVVDQEQTSSCGQGCFFFSNYWLAQSFIPSLETLTRVELKMFKNGNPPNDIIFSIKKSLTSNDLVTVIVDGSQITSSSKWIDFDFSDISVNIHSTYYMVCRIDGGSALNYYCVVFDINNPYNDGDAWGSLDSGSTWEILDNPIPGYPEPDACFKTYGLDESPDKPTITGETNGKVGIKYTYTISAIDQEGHDVYYFVDWGDKTNSGWVGPFNSGYEKSLSHTWNKKGNYKIIAKAKDLYNLEGPSENLNVNIPRNKIDKSLLNLFKERHLNFFNFLIRTIQRFDI